MACVAVACESVYDVYPIETIDMADMTRCFSKNLNDDNEGLPDDGTQSQ